MSPQKMSPFFQHQNVSVLLAFFVAKIISQVKNQRVMSPLIKLTEGKHNCYRVVVKLILMSVMLRSSRLEGELLKALYMRIL